MWRELRKKIGGIRRGVGQMKCRLEVDMEGKQKLEGKPRQGSGKPERQEGIERNKRTVKGQI